MWNGTMPTVNVNHTLNPQRITFLEAKLRSATTTSSGIGVDGVFRDPWGNPYIITIDFNGDGKCRDAFYRTRAVSQEPVPVVPVLS